MLVNILHSYLLYCTYYYLGWANVGFHNPKNIEVQTPNIDFLAKQGVILDRHYVQYVCCPSRTSFQSGRISGVVFRNDTTNYINICNNNLNLSSI